MKKWILTFILFIVPVFSQNYEPGHRQFDWLGTPKYISADSSYFRQTRPILGWHWGGTYKISKSLLVNQIDLANNWESYGFNSSNIDSNYHVVLKPKEYSHGVGPEVLNARAIQFEPTLKLDPIEPNKLVIRAGDTTRPVFGFSHIRGRILTNPSDVNFNRLIIDSTSLIGQVILDEPWPKNQFTRQGWDYADSAAIIDSFLLDKMYLSINLRRNSLGFLNDTAVLKIELPYTIKGGVGGYLRFATVPSTTFTDTLEFPRGCYRKDIDAPNNSTRAIYITKNMIPQGNKDITISALLLFNNETGPEPEFIGNHHLNKNHPNMEFYDPSHIDSIGIKVTYLSNNPVMIDWIRLESPHAREFLKGTFDDTICYHVQNDLDRLLDDSFLNKGIKLFRFNTIIEGGLFNWIAEKYFNKMIGNIGTNEVGVYYPEHYEYYVDAPDRWLGAYQIAPNVSTSYSRHKHSASNDTISNTLGLINGYNGLHDTSPAVSSYETYLAYYNYGTSTFNSLPITYFLDNDDMTAYTGALSFGANLWRISFLAHWEGMLYNNYFKKSSYGFLFSNINWWVQNFILTGLNENPSFEDSFTNYRPNTAEELRMFTWTSIIAGAKGLLYDGPETDTNTIGFLKLYDGNNLSDSTRDSLEMLSDYDFLNSDVTGGDWIRETGEINHINDRIMPLDTIALYLERPKDKIYLGRKSQRRELRKIHEFYTNNADILMNLKLQCWWAKGYKKWYLQDSNLTYNVISKFIDTSDISTFEIDAIVSEGTFEYDYTDSSFYDVTILRNISNNKFPENEFYVGVVNRRTSPLILEDDTLRFYSGAEFDDFMDYGGYSLAWNGTEHVYRTAEEWREFYWKQLGQRKISIQTQSIDYPNKEVYYKIEELTDGTEYNDSLPWWKKEQIKNRVNITVPQGQSIYAKYLAGEGKLFKVTIIYDTTSSLNGDLAFSNQTKIIAYPANQKSNYDFWKDTTTQELNFYKDDSMYYHIVYDREYLDSERSRVYYRRSAIPYDRDINTKIIQWGPEILLSDTIIFWRDIHFAEHVALKDSIQGIAGESISCKYPSIVVRYDETTDTARVYVVFSCNLPHISSHPDSCRIFMVESVFPHDTLFLPPFKAPNCLEPIAWGRVRSTEPSELDRFGGVSINASFSGNYYAWCDTLYGIGVGFKTPEDRGFITNKKYIKHFTAAQCSQPALNTYSRFSINEENCALVYREWSNFRHNIIYTRIKNESGVDNYLPSGFCEPFEPYHTNGEPSLDNKTAIINPFNASRIYFNAEFPSIYRQSAFTLRPGYEFADSMHFVGACWDRVYWTGTLGPYTTSPKSIYMKNIDMADNYNCWYLLPEIEFYSFALNLDHPHPSTGAASYNKVGTFTEFGLADSSNVLNFIGYPFLDTASYNSYVYQANFHTWINYIGRWTDTIPGNEKYNILEDFRNVGRGKYPHATHTPVITKKDDWYIHNRIYQAENDEIRTSAKLFLKGTQDHKTIYPLLSLADSNSKSLISEIFTLGNSIENRYTSIGLKAFSKNENGRIKRADTIVSNWFRIDAIKDLAFFSIISDTSLFSFELEEKSGKSLKLPLSSDRSSSLNSRKITFLNGKNKEYRIKLTKKSKDVSVWLDLLFDDKRDLSEEVSEYSSKELKKSNVEFEPKHQVYDLSDHEISSGEMINLKTYPNPAGDYIYVSCELLTEENSPVKYTLFNSTGIKVFESTSKESITIIHTDDLPSGVYFLKAEQLEFDLNSDVKPFVTKTVIIQR